MCHYFITVLGKMGGCHKIDEFVFVFKIKMVKRKELCVDRFQGEGARGFFKGGIQKCNFFFLFPKRGANLLGFFKWKGKIIFSPKGCRRGSPKESPRHPFARCTNQPLIAYTCVIDKRRV